MIYLHQVETLIYIAASNAVSRGDLTTDKDVTLLLYPESGDSLSSRVPLVSQRSTAVRGVFRFYDIIPVVRNYMISAAKVVTYLPFDFRQGDSLVPGGVLDILFMEWRWGSLTANEFVAQRFLTSSPVTLLHPERSSVAPLFFYQAPDLSGEESAYPLILRLESEPSAVGGEGQVMTFTRTKNQRTPLGVFAWYLTSVSSVLSAYVKHTFTCGVRKQTVYCLSRSRSEHFVCLRFANYFKVLEDIDLPAFVTREPATEKSDAVFGDSRRDYDADHSDTYTIETELLPAEVYDTLLAFVRSRDAKLAVNKTTDFQEVVIDEYEIIRSNRPGDPIRFTCRYRLKDTKRLL